MKFITSRLGEIDLTILLIKLKNQFAPFKWLQSIEDSNVAFVIMDPRELFPGYKLEINEKELEELNYTHSRDLVTYVIVTVPQDTSLTSADLLGPLVVNPKKRLAKQAVMPNTPYTTKHYLLDEFKKRFRRRYVGKRASM
jgi:flagellar assembly factor FliW